MTVSGDIGIFDSEQLRCRAMLGNDFTTLDDLLDARLKFCHSSGAVDDKTAYMRKMREGRITYSAIEWFEHQVIMLGPDGGVLLGRMLVDVEVDGSSKRLENRVLTVWARPQQTWRLVAFQSTPIKS